VVSRVLLSISKTGGAGTEESGTTMVNGSAVPVGSVAVGAGAVMETMIAIDISVMIGTVQMTPGGMDHLQDLRVPHRTSTPFLADDSR